MSMYQKYVKYLPAVLFLAISFPEVVENLRTWRVWLTMLEKWPQLNYILFGLGSVMLVAFLISDIRTYLKTKPKTETNPSAYPRERESKWDLLLMEKLAPEQMLELERERAKQAIELEKDKRDKHMTYFLLTVIVVVILVAIQSC